MVEIRVEGAARLARCACRSGANLVDLGLVSGLTALGTFGFLNRIIGKRQSVSMPSVRGLSRASETLCSCPTQTHLAGDLKGDSRNEPDPTRLPLLLCGATRGILVPECQ